MLINNRYEKMLQESQVNCEKSHQQSDMCYVVAKIIRACVSN